MNKLFKRISLFLIVALAVFTLIASGCVKIKPTIEPNVPKFEGVEDVTIERGSVFSPREGVKAVDVEDGEINASAITIDTNGFNPNIEGVYTIIYTVYDSDGNKTVHERKVTVVYTDTELPKLYNVADIELLIGADFTILKDVTAFDNIDGDLSAKIETVGDVDVWTPGEYLVKYSVKDTAGNETVVNRNVKVSEGNLSFTNFENLTLNSVDNKLQASITGGEIFPTIAPYALVKVELVSTADEVVTISLEGTSYATSQVTLKAGEKVAKYFKFSSPLENALLEITGANSEVSVKYAFAKAGDKEAPVVSRTQDTPVVIPVGMSSALATKEILRGVSAYDSLEGNLTSGLYVDFMEASLTTAGTYTVKAKAKDSFDNVGELEIEVIVAKAKNANVLTDPEFNDPTNTQWKVAHNSGGKVTEEIKDGMFVFTIETAGGWASGDSPYLSGITTEMLQAGNYYMFKMDVKAEVARAMQIRAGLELNGDPWIENFRDVTRYQISTEWETIYFIFYVGASKSSDGNIGVKFEIQLGNIDWSAAESNNVVYIDNAQFYLLSNDSHAPVITTLDGMKTTYTIGEQLIDYKPFIKINDIEDGEIQVTDEMIDTSKVDMSKAGEYEITITVVDEDGERATHVIKVKVLASADTEGPVISIPSAVLALIQGAMPVKEGTDLTKIFQDVLSATTIVDNVDGNITPTLEMVDLDGLVVTSPKVGTYEVKISCKDSAGNDSNVITLTITVIDATAPKFVGVRNYTVYVGDVYNPTLGVEAYDSTDGVISLTLANLQGFEEFLDNTGKVVGEPGEYQVKYVVSDEAGNEAEATAIVTVVQDKPQYSTSKTIDLLAMRAQATGGQTSISYNSEGHGVLDYKGAVGWYASAVQMKYYGINLTKDVTHKLIIEAEAELPREFVIYFVDGDGNKIPGFDGDGTITKLKVGLTTVSYVYEYEFTPTSASSSNSIFELDWDWESYLLNSQFAQVITIKQLKIVPQGDDTQVDEPQVGEIFKLDFEDGEGSGQYVNDNWTQEVYTTSWEPVSGKMNSRIKNGSKVANVYSGSSMSYRFTYNKDGESLGLASKFKIDLGNYFSNKVYKIKVAIVGVDGTLVYMLGNYETWYEMPITEALTTYEKSFPEMEVQSFYIVINASTDCYLYIDNAILEGPIVEPDGVELLRLDFEDGAGSDKYVNSAWTQYKYTTAWEKLTSSQMNSRTKNGSKVANVFSDYNMAYKYVYNETGAPIGKATSFQIDLGNYYSGFAYTIKLALQTTSGSLIYVLGSADAWYTMEVTEALNTFTKEFAEAEIQSFYISIKASKTAYLYMDNVVIKGPEQEASPSDTTAPVITVSEQVLQALSQMELFEGTSLVQVFATLKAGVSIVDDVDGTIEVVDSMFDLGGLNLANPVKGTYTIKIKASDAAGNEAELSLPIVIKEVAAPVQNANLNLDYESLTAGTDYSGTDWTVYKYTSAWEKVTSTQMRVRTSPNSTNKVLNMACGYGIPYKYCYNEAGSTLGKANHFEIKLGNYFSGAQVINYKIALVGTDGTIKYIKGSQDEYVAFNPNTDLELITVDFEDFVVQSFYISIKSSKSDGAYLYMDDVKLVYNEQNN